MAFWPQALKIARIGQKTPQNTPKTPILGPFYARIDDFLRPLFFAKLANCPLFLATDHFSYQIALKNFFKNGHLPTFAHFLPTFENKTGRKILTNPRSKFTPFTQISSAKVYTSTTKALPKYYQKPAKF